MVLKKFGLIIFFILIGFFSGFIVNMYDIYPVYVKELYTENQQNDLKSQIYEKNVSSLIHVNDYLSKTKIQNDLVSHIWKQKNLPSHEPLKLETNISSDKFSNLRNLNSIDKFTIEMEHEINSIAYLFKPSISNNKLIIYHQGHKGDFFEGKQTIQYFLEKNYSVIAFSMPLLGMNSQPVVDIPQFGKIKINSHNQLELLETENLSPIKFFIEPVIVIMNYFENNYDFDSYHMVGISGGGWVTVLSSSIDERITQSYSVAGSFPLFLRSDPKNFGDYEQHNLELYRIANYLDLYILASLGNDRKFVQIFNKYDPCCFDGDIFSSYEHGIKKILNKMNEGYFEIYLDDTHREHIISKHSLEIIITEIEN